MSPSETATNHTFNMTEKRRPGPHLVLSFIALIVTLCVCDASSPATKLFHFQCRRKHCKRHDTSPDGIGSLIHLKRPTTERVSQWFHNSNYDFNHNDAGMTNPCLHIDLNEQHDVVDVSASSSMSTSSNDNDWWPACPSSSKGWRRIRLSRRVGWGFDCYTAVRDAALEWEFCNDKVGIVQVHTKQAHAEQYYQRRDSYGTGYDIVHNMSFGDGNLYGPSGDNAMKIWTGPGGRRLATFTKVFKSKWLPRIYCVSPVTVVYDLVDQRGPSTTYSSTAYATCKGHWLRGEERLTVAHRDDGNVDVELVSFSKHGNSLWGRMVWPFIGPLQGRFFESQMDALQAVAAHAPHSNSEQQVMGAVLLNSDDNSGAGRRGPTAANDSIIR